MYSSLTVKGRKVMVEGSDAWLEKLQSLTYEQSSRPIFQARTSLDCRRGHVHGSLEYPGIGESDFEQEDRFVQGSFPLHKLITFFLSHGYNLSHGRSTLEGSERYLFVQMKNALPVST